MKRFYLMKFYTVVETGVHKVKPSKKIMDLLNYLTYLTRIQTEKSQKVSKITKKTPS